MATAIRSHIVHDRGGKARNTALAREGSLGCFWPLGPQPAGPSQTLSLQGRLTGLGGEDLPTIVIVAHYDAFGVAPVRMHVLWGGARASPSQRCSGPARMKHLAEVRAAARAL